ncbi:MAG: flagellar hook-associated protein FlgK [Alishewanella agri]|nr:flagellar hook-associated protein FlgK [Alishewanella agri]
MSDNLLKIGTTAIRANSLLLNTTSNNIANINTEGYVRQRTEFVADPLGFGVGRGTTERLLNEFTVKQLRRDTSKLYFAQQYVSEANRVDALFSNPANSIATGMNDLFSQLQTANNDPVQPANRQLVIGSAQSLINRFDGMSNLLKEQEIFINDQFDIYVNEANDMIKQIAIVNKDIAAYGNGATRPVPLELLDKRDLAILNLSKMLEISVLDAANGEKLVFMNDGQSLVVEQGDFRLLSLRGDPDPNRKELQLQLNSNANILRDVNSKSIGGQLGALVAFREEILDPSQTQLGQLALSLADALNSQNKLGMTLDGTLGKDLFRLPVFSGLNYSDNTGTASVTVALETGKGNQLPPNDFLISITGPGQVTVDALNSKGEVIAGPGLPKVINGLDFTNTVTLNSDSMIPTDPINKDLLGLEITISPGAAVGDRFMLKPLQQAATQLQMATNRGEDIALASPVRTSFTSSNLGNSRIENIVVTNTNVTPSFLSDEPYSIVYTGANTFRIFDGASNLIGEATFSNNNYRNILANSTPPLELGFDFDVSGVPSTGDSFTIEFNDNGFNDNRNGLTLAALQNADSTRRNAATIPGAVNEYSFNQSYATMVGTIGERTRQGRTLEEANSAILEQTTLWYESLSGVSLDEEAANLTRFQQTYAAAARILSTSQTIFDTLLQAVR